MVLDDLTKLYNRRELFIRLRQEIARSKRSHIPFSILLIDIDHFKTVNDNYGHLRGDRVLTEAAEIIKENCREMDIPCRYGGDEFVILVPETDRYSAEKAADRLLERFCNHTFIGYDEQPDLHVTVSIGTATYESNVEKAEILIERADQALYSAKKSGRNQICKDIDTQKVSKEPRLNFKGFVDRDQEMESLKQMFDDARLKKGGLVFVHGEAGIGKTRLVSELEKYTKLHKALFVTAKPFEFGVTPPYHIFFQVIKSYVKCGSKVRAQVISTLPSVYKAELVKFIPDLRVAISPTQQSTRISPEYEKMRLFDAVFQAIELMTHDSPVFIFFDDMQWSRDADLELLGYLARNITHLPLLICCAYRAEEIDEKHPLKHFLRALSREHRFESMRLQGLSERDTALLINTIIGFTVPIHISGMICQETNGNPFYVEEIIKSFVAQNILYWDGSRWTFRDIEKITLPSSVGDLLRRRLEDVDDEIKNVLSVASAIGNHFTLSLLQRVTGSNEGYLLDVLDEALRRGLISLEGEDQYSFASILLQRTLYEDVSTIKKRRLHLKIAQSIEHLFYDELESVYESLAYHYLIAEYWESAFEYNFRAAEKLKNVYANQDAILRYRTCLKLIKNNEINRPDIEIQIYTGLADVYYIVGSYGDSIKYNRQVLESSDLTNIQRSDVYLHMGRVFQRLADFENSLKSFEEGKALLDPQEHRFKIAMLDAAAMWIYTKQGNIDKAQAIAEQTLPVFETEGNDEDIGTLYGNLGTLYFDLGEWNKAEEYYLKSLEYREHAGNEYSIASGLNNLGNVCQRRGDFDKAAFYHKRALQIREKIGDRYGIASSYNNLALIYDYTGEWQKCLDYHHKSLDISVQICSPHSVALSYSNIGFILIKKGDFENALQYSLKALEAGERIGDRTHIASIMNNLGSLYTYLNELDKAQEILEKGRESIIEHGYKNLQAENSKLFAEYHLAKGDIDKVLTLVEEAIRISGETGDRDMLAESYIVAGRNALEHGDIPKAVQWYDKCDEISRPMHNKFVCGKCAYYKGIALKQKGDLEGAQRCLIQAREILEELGAQYYLNLIKKIL